MKKFFLATILLLLLPLKGFAFDHEHKEWSSLLSKYQTKDGSIRYKDWKTQQTKLDQYLASLEAINFNTYSSWQVNQKKAFLINAYNAFTIKLILKNYPVDSIKDIGSLFSSPWKKKFFSILDGKIKSLDPIEHDWLRKKKELADARVHAAVNCASISCPRLRHEAFTANDLEKQLNDSVRQWLNDPSRNQFEQGHAKLSKIFDWFDEDFEDSDEGILRFIEKHSPEKRKILGISPKISYLDYDWGLNEAPKK